MDINMFVILVFAGMAFYIASFFVKDFDEKAIATIISMVLSFAIMAASMFVTHVLPDSTTESIGEPYTMGALFFFLAIGQILRLYHWYRMPV